MAITRYGVFDVLGPIMIGPSSSHTAGAAKLGKIAKIIVGEEYNKVHFYLHGSFGKTYKGHGTDRALVAGVLGMDPGDEKLRNAMDIAKEKNLDIVFEETDLGDFQHPNTVKMVFYTKSGKEFSITGSSTGGGSILITDIEGTEVNITGNRPTIMIKYKNLKGVLSSIVKTIVNNGNKVNLLNVERSVRKNEAVLVIETVEAVDTCIAEELFGMNSVILSRCINPA